MSKLKYFNGTNWVEVNGNIVGDTLPIGSIIPYGSTTAPANWLVCDGSYVSKDTYSELYAVVGDSFLDGGTAPTGTFRLPNFNKRVPVGYDSTDTDFDTIGETGGEKTHILTTQEMPEHGHTVKDSSRNIGISTGTISGSNDTKMIDSLPNSSYGLDNSHALRAENTGGGQAHNNLQPYQVVCYIIKVSQSAGLVATVSNTSSDSTTDTYSCDYINESHEWKLLQDNVSANTEVSLSSITFNEIWCVARYTDEPGHAMHVTIPKSDLTSSYKDYRAGYYFLSTFYGGVMFKAKLTSVKFGDFYVNSSSVSFNSKMTVYYR